MGPFVLHSLMGIEGNGLFINLFSFFFFFFLLLPKFPLVFVKSSYKNRKPLQEYCHLVKQKHLHLFLFFLIQKLLSISENDFQKREEDSIS
jgi:hypothetical protein